MSEQQQLLAARDRLQAAVALLNQAMEILVLAALCEEPRSPTPIRTPVEDDRAAARAAYDRYVALYDQVAAETGIRAEMAEPQTLDAVETAIERLHARRKEWTGDPPRTDSQARRIMALLQQLGRDMPRVRLSASGAAYLTAQLVHESEQRKRLAP